MTGCPFCRPNQSRVFFDEETILCLWDGYPVAPGHALVVPRRHVASWFEATRTEQLRLLEGIDIAKREIVARHDPDGFNIGINIGEAAGQTVNHLHVHVIPRYRDDVPDPRGGVRHVIPCKGNYLADGVREGEPPYRALTFVPAIVGESDTPLLRYLREDLAGAERVDLAVAFILESGLELVRPHLEDVLDRGGRVRVLTGDYLGVTEPRALVGLLDLEGDIQRRVFVTDPAHGFHPKAYLVRRDPDRAVAYIGSSNLSRSALERGVEWNHRLDGARHREDLERIGRAFEALFHHSCTVPLTADWIEAYQRCRPSQRELSPEVDPTADAASPPPQPHAVQAAALEALAATRTAGNRAGLVVLATGLGKTWLSAFDSQGFNRVLFVAHRAEILRQARDTFRRIRPDASLGLYTGTERSPTADVLFASVQTLGRARHLENFTRDAFDYVVVDEFHHACATTYRRLIDHFEPKFMLGLTATPERTDGGDLLTLCGENLVYRCDLGDGISQGLLAPFHYFGVPDEVEYDNIPWRSGRFDPEALYAAVATQARANNALEQWRKRGGRRTLAFCASVRHAEYMLDFFTNHGVAAAAVHSEPTTAPRALTLERLEAGELAIVFAVDLFNEGVDLPRVDTVLMLRPTESRILWLQQFGRGLRLAEDKDHLTVIDYVGNHRTFLQVPMLLLPGCDDHAGAVAMALEAYRRNELELPPGCEVTYEVEALEILERLSRPTGGGNLLRAWYEAFRDRNDVRPTALETWHAGHDPKSVRRNYRSWFGFVATMGDLDKRESVAEEAARTFLRELEKTPMTKSYKMVLLLAMIGEEAFPGSISIDRLAQAVRRQARRVTALTNDFGDALDDDGALQQLLLDNPIDAWIGGMGTGGTAYFSLEDTTFSSNIPCPLNATAALRTLSRELCEWRLGQYLERIGRYPRFVCNVSHTDGRPILFLPERDKHPGIPTGWTQVVTSDGTIELKFVKIAVNAARRPGEEGNVLPDLLRHWFGPNAGQPGQGPNRVQFTHKDGHYRMTPIGVRKAVAEVGHEYARNEIAPLWGLPFEEAKWRQTGFVVTDDHIFLLVTLEKTGMREEHQYKDRFFDAEHFQWQSQNRTTQGGKHGQALRHHRERGIAVHLFVRRFPRTQRGKAAPFIYCGDLEFESWKGEKPITIQWRLETPLPATVRVSLGMD